MAREKYYFPNKSSAFRDLPDEELQRLIKGYTKASTLSQILKDYPRVNSRSFYKHLPYQLTEKKCDNCGNRVYHKPKRRTGNREKWLCIDCNHDFTRNCTCNSCKTQRRNDFQKQNQEYQQQSYEWLQEQQEMPYNPCEISLLEEIQLFLIARSYTHDYGFIDFNSPINKNYKEITREYKNFISQLIKKKLLIPIAHNSFEKHYKKDKNGRYTFSLDPKDSYWKINLTLDQEAFLDKIREKQYSEEDKNVLNKEIYQNALVQYFNDHVGFLKGIIQKDPINVYLDDFIENYPFSKAATILYLSLNSCLHYLFSYSVNEETLNEHFANTLRSNIERYKKDHDLKEIKNPDYENADIKEYIEFFIAPYSNLLNITTHTETLIV